MEDKGTTHSSNNNKSGIVIDRINEITKIKLLPIPENEKVKSFKVPNRNNNNINITFQDITYNVSRGFFRRSKYVEKSGRNGPLKKTTLLNEVNGKFLGGKLTAVIGPSGAGKSTLINILSGYTSKGYTGKIYLNDEIKEDRKFKDISCYIMQDDKLQPLLSVMEAMTVSANLKLPLSINNVKKSNRIKEILQSVNLWDHRFVKTMSLSGGQRKRLSLALELVNDPTVLFLDEPTSGLDSLTSKQCVKLLKDLALKGKTVICSIHQPSATILDLFDQMYVLAIGKCIYQGAVAGLLPYLDEAELKCPPYHNPADYVLEVATGEHGDCIDRLVRKSKNGLTDEWENLDNSLGEIKSYENIKALMAAGRISPIQAPTTPTFLFPCHSLETYSNISETKKKKCCGSESYPTTSLHQFKVLLKRSSTKLYRDKALVCNRIITHLAIGAFLGILCYGIGTDGSKTMTNFNLMFFSVMFLMFTAFNSVVTTFPLEMSILTQEYFNKWYCLKSYYIATSVADIPIQICATLLYAIVTYCMTMQPMELYRIGAFFFMCILISLTAQSFGFFVGACMDLKNAVIFGPFCLLPFTIFSGFFVKYSDCPKALQWFFHISFLKYGFEGLMKSVFGYDRPKLSCDKEYCHYINPQKFLRDRDMDKALYFNCVCFFIALIMVLKVMGYFALKSHIKVNRNNNNM